MNASKYTKYIMPGLMALAIALAVPVTALAKDKHEDRDEKEDSAKITLQQCPAAVQSTVQNLAAGAKIGEVEKETEKGAVTYEVEIIKADGTKTEVCVAADGTVIKSKDKKCEDDENKAGKKKGKKEKDDDDDDDE